MQPQKPGVLTDNLLQHVSVAKTLAANVSIGSPTAFDMTGIPTEFKQDNADGTMVRVGPTQPTSWAGANIDTTITHNLGRVPIGYYVTRKYSACDVYDDGTNSGWTTEEIVLKNTDGAADTVVYIF